MSEDFFDLFSLTPQFDLSSEILEKAYISLQKKTHPDEFSTESAMMRQAAAHFSSCVNQGYHTLKSPLRRAELLFKRAQRWPVPPCQAVLEEALTLGEEGQGAPHPAAFQEKIAVLRQESHAHLATAFSQQDWPQAFRAYGRLSYLEKLRTPS